MLASFEMRSENGTGSDTEMSTVLNTIAAGELKRRGLAGIEEKLKEGPVHVIRRNRPAAVVLSEEEFAELVTEAERSWIAESLADVREGRTRTGTVADLLVELRS
jgi:PHD/YefM family antitoxin component YafN of YafNO toxin-antitoxin module